MGNSSSELTWLGNVNSSINGEVGPQEVIFLNLG